MSLTRLITWMSGVSEIAIRALPPVERLRLAHECRRLLVAAEPQPAAPKGLVQRTQARILRDRAHAADRRRSELLLGALVVFGWASGWVFWTLARVATGGNLNVLGTNLVSGLTWSLVSTVLVWMTAATAALMLGRRREMRRFL